MTDEYFLNFENRTYDDLCEATGFLEKSEVSDNRSVKIYLLRELCEMNRLRLEINRLTVLKTDLIPQYNLLPFFGNRDVEENRKKLRLLKSRLNRLWKLDKEARAQNNLGKFNLHRLQAKYA